MARITIESINEELKETGWKCISETYQNLDTPLEFECDEGHTIQATWKKIRSKRECPRCKDNKLKEERNESQLLTRRHTLVAGLYMMEIN